MRLVQELEKNKAINQILITTSTLSSAQIFIKFNLKKTVHQFFPIDTEFFSNKFLNYWEPTIAIFVESEIWPNIFMILSKKKIPLIFLMQELLKDLLKMEACKKILKLSFSKYFNCLPSK
ncbi:glycosyltransferase N-terminal domain-containing protein [Candidatus Pelagibacter sp. Uisw_114]